MQGMILAAGFGTRLKPVTDTIPKALVTLLNKPMLHYVIDKFIENEITDIFINAHYFAEQIIDFVKKSDFKADIKVVTEENILGTGGGIFNMLPFIIDDDFIVYNTDVISDVNLKNLMKYHKAHFPIATMVMQNRDTFNQVVIDSDDRFCGLNLVKKGIKNMARVPVEPSKLLAFCGIHAINKSILRFKKEEEEYSIINVYLDAVIKGENIIAYKPDINWFDIGTIEKLRLAESYLKSKTEP